MTSSESEEHAPRSRKRSRKSGSGEGGGAGAKKARGRPRVNTEDATAADRRRTQIRLAQRAYRQRKETTITSLKNQSTHLHSIIEQMNDALLQLNASAVKSGLLQLNPALAKEFKHVTETFSGLVKAASEGQYEGDEDGEAAENMLDVQKPPEPEPEPQHVGWGYSDVSKTAAKERMHQTLPIPESYFSHLGAAYGQQDANNISLIRRRQFTIGEVLSQSHRIPPPPSNQSSAHMSSVESTQLPFGLVDLLSQQQASFIPLNPHIYPIRIPTPETTPPMTRLPTPPLGFPKYSTKSLPPVTTYSFQETTFARRLTRAALETGFQLLSNANARPAALNYVFKLSLPYSTLEQLRTRFRIIMSRSIDEDLDWWDHPFIHLGGAGTHYPRQDAAGNIVPVKNGWTVRSIGPREKRTNMLVNTEDGRTEEMRVDLGGMEGQWFDSHDVQGYLEEKYACKLDPKSSFAECLVEDDDDEDTSANPFKMPQECKSTTRRVSDEDPGFPSLSHSTSNSSTNSTTSITPPNNAYSLRDTAPLGLDMAFNHTPMTSHPSDYTKLVDYDISFDQTLGLDLAPGFDYGFASNNAFQMGDMDLGLDMMGENVESLPVVRQKRKKSVWLDVSRLIDEITKHGVCLGRAPGYRRKDVDRAVMTALIQEH